MTIPLTPPHATSSLLTILFTAGDQLMVPRGVTHISCHYKNTIEGTGGRKKKEQTNKHKQYAWGYSRAEREFSNTLCMCRLALVWILANFYKATGMQTHLPSLWLDPHVMLTRLSATVSGVGLSLSVSCRQLSQLLFPTNSLLAVPLPLPDPPRFQIQKPFVWFRAKTDKGIVCLAGHLHSVTR